MRLTEEEAQEEAQHWLRTGAPSGTHEASQFASQIQEAVVCGRLPLREDGKTIDLHAIDRLMRGTPSAVRVAILKRLYEAGTLKGQGRAGLFSK